MTRSGAETGYEVGRGKPPLRTRFQPGQSGNPRGRPKGARNLHTILDETLSERVVVSENGKRRSCSKLELIVRQLVNKAAAGETKNAILLLKLLPQTHPPTPNDQPIASAFGGADDDKLLTDMLDEFGITTKARGEGQ